MKWLALMILAGCASTMQNGFSLDQATWQHDEKDIRQRASFELKCAPEGLQLTVLSGRGTVPESAGQVGVVGCDHRLVYVHSSSGWVLNSADAQAR